MRIDAIQWVYRISLLNLQKKTSFGIPSLRRVGWLGEVVSPFATRNKNPIRPEDFCPKIPRIGGGGPMIGNSLGEPLDLKKKTHFSNFSGLELGYTF